MFVIGEKTRCILPRLTCSLRIRCQSSVQTPTTTSSKQIEGKTSNAQALWATSETNRLIEHLALRIKAAGPITVADFMREALTNPKFVRHFVSFSTR